MRQHRRRFKIWLESYRSLGKIKEAGFRIRASCQKCRSWHTVDIDRMIDLHGEDFSIVGRRGTCPHPDCGGSCVFLGSPGEGTPFMPLVE